MAHSAYPTSYMADRAGTARIEPQGKFEAGTYQDFTLTYTAGFFGIDDTGSLKIVHRFASDMGKPQFTDPDAPNFVTVEASNGAVLSVEYDGKRNVRPWDKTLFIRVVKGFLREGDQIIVRFGDRRRGSPGMRVQTFCESTFEFKVLVDPWATYTYIELPQQPEIAVVSGPPVTFKIVGPTHRRVGETFRIGVKGEDKWGNPSDQVSGEFLIKASIPVDGLPELVKIEKGMSACALEGLSCSQPGVLALHLCRSNGEVVASAAPIVISEVADRVGYWGDLHGQSEETIGTNSARELIEFARDRAFVDLMSHQGNDFQITLPFWNELNRLTAEFNEDGRFIIFPGYEWSGNTGLGGDRNVLFAREGRTIRRSHHALVEDLSDAQTDAHTANDLFNALQDEDCVVFAHIGGRYADINISHDVRIERSVEVHSDWGTFEWLLHDAFDQGYRVGILANSDGHKGRHGASHPGASLFGAYGGLSCLLSKALTRQDVFEALRNRKHYATTGSRMYLAVQVHVPGEANVYTDAPVMGGAISHSTDTLTMGDIASYSGPTANLQFDLRAASPIERIDVLNGREIVHSILPELLERTSRRVRILWEGSEYRGRGRQTIWDGSLSVEGNAIQRVIPINWWNLDKPLTTIDSTHLKWEYLTTGGYGGIEIWLDSPSGGTVSISTALVKATIDIDQIGREEIALEAGGLSRRVRIFRLPESNSCSSIVQSVEIPLVKDRDNPLYVRVRTEDGHLCWSSPVYLIE